METTERKVPFDQVFKLVAIGDEAVGKSCLLLQFTAHKFRPGLDPTIGAESSSRIIHHRRRRRRQAQVFRRLTRPYYERAAAAILVYDVTRRETFDHVGSWLREATERAPANLTVVLVGNKCDLQDERAVSYKEGRAFAEEHGLLFMEASRRKLVAM